MTERPCLDKNTGPLKAEQDSAVDEITSGGDISEREAILIRACLRAQAAEISCLKAGLLELATAVGIESFRHVSFRQTGSPVGTGVATPCLSGETPPAGPVRSCSQPADRPADCPSDADRIPETLDLIDQVFAKLIAG